MSAFNSGSRSFQGKNRLKLASAKDYTWTASKMKILHYRMSSQKLSAHAGRPSLLMTMELVDYNLFPQKLTAFIGTPKTTHAVLRPSCIPLLAYRTEWIGPPLQGTLAL
jgi:hypothetical protein